MSQDTTSINDILDEYAHMFRMVYGHEPAAHYIRDGWFRVNGETMHYTMLTGEIENLRHLARRQRMQSSGKGAIQRLIAKLRGIA